MQTPPHRDLKRYDRLREIGVNRVSFCFEIFDRELFEEICPGKHAEYGLDYYLEAIRYCATLAGTGRADEPWVTNGEIIAGLEPPESSIRAIDWITSVGAIPTVCVFRPLVGTDLEDPSRRRPRTWSRSSAASTRRAWRRACRSAGAERPRLAGDAARGVPRLLARSATSGRAPSWRS